MDGISSHMIRVMRIVAGFVLAFGILLCLWGLHGTLAPPANGGYEVTRFLAKTGAVIAAVSAVLVVAMRNVR